MYSICVCISDCTCMCVLISKVTMKPSIHTFFQEDLYLCVNSFVYTLINPSNILIYHIFTARLAVDVKKCEFSNKTTQLLQTMYFVAYGVHKHVPVSTKDRHDSSCYIGKF